MNRTRFLAIAAIACLPVNACSAPKGPIGLESSPSAVSTKTPPNSTTEIGSGGSPAHGTSPSKTSNPSDNKNTGPMSETAELALPEVGTRNYLRTIDGKSSLDQVSVKNGEKPGEVIETSGNDEYSLERTLRLRQHSIEVTREVSRGPKFPSTTSEFVAYTFIASPFATTTSWSGGGGYMINGMAAGRISFKGKIIGFSVESYHGRDYNAVVYETEETRGSEYDNNPDHQQKSTAKLWYSAELRAILKAERTMHFGSSGSSYTEVLQ